LGCLGVSLFLHEAVGTPVAGTAAVSGSCDDTPVTAFVPNVTYTIGFPSPDRISPVSSCSASAALSGDIVNGDTAPTVGCSLTDATGGYAILNNIMPRMKIGGLQCVVEDRSSLEVNGDGSDNIKFDIAIDSLTATSWDPSKKVDASTSSSKIMLFGTGGQISSQKVIDGSDNDGLTNGEVTFGGSLESTGGSRTFLKVDYTNYRIDSSVDRETLTFTFTPSN